MEVREELKYSEEHEWISVEDKIVTMGITDFAQNSLGDVVFVELPEVGELVEAGAEVGSIESVKAVAELYCPVDGEVIEVNKELEESPELVNSSPYDEGWMLKIKVDPASIDESELMDAEAYKAFAK
jgi:glycine cleavage system H protein